MTGPMTGPGLRVLVNTEDFSPLGGVEHSTLQVSRALAARGHRIDLLHADRTHRAGAADAGLRPEWETFAAGITRVPGFTVAAARPWRTLHHLPPAVRATRALQPDVIWLNRSEQLLWGLGAARATDAPLVVHLRHHPYRLGPLGPRRAGRALVGALTGRADRYLAVSAWLAREWVAAGLDPALVEVVPNGIDPARYTPTDDAGRAAARARLLPDLAAAPVGSGAGGPEHPVVLHYGRLAADKGVPQLLEAWARLAADPVSSTRPATLLLVGDPTPEVAPVLAARVAAHAGTPRPVRHLPRQSDVTALLHAADLMVLPAVWHEPFGRVVIEAMAAQVPVVATATGGIPEILTGRFADQLVPATDPDALVPALAAAIDRRLGWRRSDPALGPAGRAHVEAHFSLEATTDRVEQALRAAHAGSRTAAPTPGDRERDRDQEVLACPTPV
ncbi:glycosyltransferase involved in cell wall biosynthesis [Friedmanniella endophytica]|uniref:Glycosyltransferase involved in cell wall biosynthesis n=1 Tax=Microlunatus kandeliicorticis TaxID=1759536 RepID=A0A7W3P496_9ACTN|nr:glycosyltransferase family 4 protein [Microlunatus kandeliicorticis]MBA8792646.1 glycosyltransferase involved in cell wall biosynthesis [Microlunatus kandeliicorticis]